jgi:hypothetical protein
VQIDRAGSVHDTGLAVEYRKPGLVAFRYLVNRGGSVQVDRAGTGRLCWQ